MCKNKKLYSEIKNKNNKFIFYKRKINFELVKKQIEFNFKSLSKVKKGIVALDTEDKIKFITRFYSCNKAGLIVFISNKKSYKELKKEKININYIFRNDKLLEISKKHDTYPKDLAVILKTSGSTDFAKYVYVSNSNISFITSEMNKEMFNNRKSYNELIFAPMDHAFALGRMH